MGLVDYLHMVPRDFCDYEFTTFRQSAQPGKAFFRKLTN